MLHVYPGKTVMFSFCQAKSVVSTASDVITLLHNAYLLTWLAISIICFTCSFSYPLVRCYAVTNCLPEPWLSICISHYTRSFSYLMLRCYAVTMLCCYDVTLLRCLYESFYTVIFVSAVTMLQCYAVTMLRCYNSF